MIRELKRKNPDISNIVIALPGGKIIYRAEPDFIDTYLPDSLKADFGISPGKKKKGRYTKEYIQIGNDYHILSPIKDKTRKWSGTIDISFQKEFISSKCNKVIFWNLRVLGVIILAVAMLMILCLHFYSDTRTVQAYKKRLKLILFILIGGSQLVYGFYNAGYLKDRYSDMIREKVEKISFPVKEKMNSFLREDIQADYFKGADFGINDIITQTPEIEDIRILDADKKFLYLRNGVKTENSDQIPNDSEYQCLYPVPGKDGTGFFLDIRISQKTIHAKLRDIFLDLATVLLISFVFITELLILLSIFIDKYLKTEKQIKQIDKEKEQPPEAYPIIRPNAFIYQVAMTLPFSFIPLYAEDLYTSIAGLSKEFVMSLPVSMNMFCTTIAFLIGGSWMDRKGWQSLYFWGILFTATGLFLCGIAQNVVEFILFRGLSGFGFGSTLMSCMGFVYANTHKKNQTMGFATMSAGGYSGFLCGTALGGMLAERIGFSSVFIVSSVSMVAPIIFPVLFMKHTFQKKSKHIHQTYKNKKAEIRTTLKFLMNRNIFSLLLFLSVPSSIAFAGLLYYFCPVYLERLGVSQANIARLLMINGLSMIYISPLISPAIDRSSNKTSYLVISGIIGSFGLLIFYYIEGVPVIVLAIVMTSLSAGIGYSARPVYALQQNITNELGAGKSIGIYRTVERLGWVMGPLVFGMIMASGNTRQGLTVAGLVYLLLTLLFIVASEKDGK